MPRQTDGPLTKHTLNLYAGDVARVQDLYPGIPAAVIIRKVLRKFLNEIEEKATAEQTHDLSADALSIALTGKASV